MHALEAGDGRAYNVGTGRGVSVREILESVRRVTGVDVTGLDGARREGDPPMLYNDPSKITAALGWTAKYMEIADIVATAWDWMQAHPEGWSS